MTFGLILKRMRRNWRSMAILLLAVCLLTGFFALGPFYIRAVTDVGLRFELDNASRQSKQISLIVEDEPLTLESFEVVRQELGSLAVGVRHFIRADYTAPTSEQGFEAGLATGALMYQYGEPVTFTSPRIDAALQPFAFADMPELLDLVEGRWPVRLPTPEEVDPTGLSDAEQQARQIGIYTRGQIEAVITRTVAERSGLERGSRLVLGNPRPDGTGALAVMVVVGIVEPKNPADPFWEGNRNFLEGAEVEIGLGTIRYDYGFATLPEAYTDWLRDVVPGSSYFYQIDTNTDTISAANLQDVHRRLQVLQNRLSAYHPGLTVLSGLTAILDGFSADVSETQGPITLLSGAILVMMLYHLINTVALVLEQQGVEWSTIVSRGGSVPQLVGLQLVSVGLLAVVGILAGPLFSMVFMRLMERFGPLAEALGGRPLGSTAIPRISLVLSAVAGVASALVLTLPAIPAARRSLLRLKQLVSRPPTTPTWARYAIDAALLAVGVAFMLRLYYLVGGDFGNLLNNLFAAPRDVVALIADNLTETGGLNDPFNLLGPALVLTGAALLWLRAFPALMGALARFSNRSRSLTTPLAVWNVARDPGHYAQLVLLLIGTLALGTASLGLSATRDRGAWSAAERATGGSARLSLDPGRLEPARVAWTDLPGVQSSVALMRAAGDPGSISRRPVQIIGVDPDAIPVDFAELRQAAEPLRGIETPPAPGLALPAEASALSVQVYSLPSRDADAPPVAVQLTAYLEDARGVPLRVPLAPPDAALAAGDVSGETVQTPASAQPVPTLTGEWLNFSGELPPRGKRPLRLVRIGINSRQGNLDAFEHAIYLDRLAVVDAFGKATTLSDFEPDGATWAEARVANPYAGSWTSQASNQNRVLGVRARSVTGEVPGVEGPTVLRLEYFMNKISGVMREPSIVVNEVQTGRVPVVVNRAFAELFGGRGPTRTAIDKPLEPGEMRNLILNMGPGSVEIGYEVVGVIDTLPSVDARDPLLITLTDRIRPIINQASSSSVFFDENEVWLEMPGREPSPALQDAIAGMDGVTGVNWAWTRYGEILREPLPSAVAGMLYAGFWVSLLLSLLDFGFYLVVTARQRAFTFGVLRALGWDARQIWRLLFVEQVVLITPALVIGSLIGLGLAYLLLPFLALVGSETLRVPWLALGGMLLALVAAFTVLMGVAAIFLRRMSVNQVLRLGEE
jgi:hypothetical protein